MELLLDARENSERLLAMVNNLLDLARLEKGSRQLEVRPESPESLLQPAADAIRPRAEDKGVEIVLDVPPGLPPVAVDATRLGHALRNLLDNSLTYTDRGGRITLAARADSDAVTLSVADTGIGITPEAAPHVFERFYRADQARSREQGGFGLGLSIVKWIAESHKGTVQLSSQPGVGSTFTVLLQK